MAAGMAPMHGAAPDGGAPAPPAAGARGGSVRYGTRYVRNRGKSATMMLGPIALWINAAA
eukprot:COSAG02_NODE_44394_length_366_cov_1.445693_1_plen_59_part_10